MQKNYSNRFEIYSWLKKVGEMVDNAEKNILMKLTKFGPALLSTISNLIFTTVFFLRD